MWIFYLIACLPILVGAIIFYFNKRVCWSEYLIGCGAALLLAVIFNVIAVMSIRNQTIDIQTISGEIDRVEYRPAWTEQYRQRRTRSVGSGKNRSTQTYYTTEFHNHPEHWRAYFLFNGEVNDYERITEAKYTEIALKLGNKSEQSGKQSSSHGGFRISGDNSIYAVNNTTGYIYPVTKLISFENKIKAVPNLFQFSKIATNISVFSYPPNYDWERSDRLVGTASVLIDQTKFDQLNSVVGPRKKCNVILVGFGQKPAIYGDYQQSSWLNGRKNDLVICFGGGSKTTPASWSKVFSWSESDICKKNIETILLTNPINDSILPLVQNEIVKNYTIKDWSKFDYIKVSPRPWVYGLYITLMIISQVILHIVFHYNETDKNGVYRKYANFKGFKSL